MTPFHDRNDPIEDAEQRPPSRWERVQAWFWFVVFAIGVVLIGQIKP
jgi:hypothetical protein